jgi:hypothetical protein
LLDDASVAVMLRDGDDITAVSRPTRTIPTKVRRALETRYPTCGVPGCANDQFLEIDHVVSIEDHGATEIAELVAAVFTPPRPEDVPGLEGRGRQRRSRPRTTR